MKYKDLFKYAKEHNIDEKLCSYLINNYLFIPNIDRIENILLDKKVEKRFKHAIQRLKKEPIQYIVGNVDFYGYTYKVNKNTLIPRFETEELVENTIKIIEKKFNKDIKLIDIGTGSGCIGITIKKELPNIDVTLTDISTKALKVAKDNSKELDIKIIKSDILKNIKKENYDVLISNPPYISKDEYVMDLVKNNEPKKALYAKNNGLYFYEQILKDAKRILNKKYLIALEIGRTQKEDIIKIINNYLENVNIITKKDLQGNNRFIFIISE